MTFEPKIVAFLCHWCSYTGADLAGAARLNYPANVRVIRLMCSGRVDPTFVLKAFAAGADGVLVAGCHLGDCHYLEGNYKTMRRMTLLGKALQEYGIEPGRLRLEWISAAQGERFAQVVAQMTEAIRLMGPYGGGTVEAENELTAVVSAAGGEIMAVTAQAGEIESVAAQAGEIESVAAQAGEIESVAAQAGESAVV